MSSSHMCVEMILYPCGRLIKIGLVSGCKTFTGVPGRTKCPVAPASAIASLFVIFSSDVGYAASIVLGVYLLMVVVFSSSSLLLPVACSANLL